MRLTDVDIHIFVSVIINLKNVIMKLKVGFSEKRYWLWFVEISVTPQTNCSGLDYFYSTTNICIVRTRTYTECYFELAQYGESEISYRGTVLGTFLSFFVNSFKILAE